MITVSLLDCHTAGCQSDSIFLCTNGLCFPHTQSHHPPHSYEDSQRLDVSLDRKRWCVNGADTSPEWVMAMLLYVFCGWTFKAHIETVKRTYWLQPLTRWARWLPIFHPPWDIIAAVCSRRCGWGGAALTVFEWQGWCVCLHTSPRRMDTSRDRVTQGGGWKEWKKINLSEFSTMDSYCETTLQAALVCF